MIHALVRERGYRCAWVDERAEKRRSSRLALEVDPIEPWAKGGGTEVANLRFLCRNHHRRVSLQQFGNRRRE
jgi:5-methylcytosine-specific restriction endonuclease McrA